MCAYSSYQRKHAPHSFGPFRRPPYPDPPDHAVFVDVEVEGMVGLAGVVRMPVHSCAPNCYTDERDGRIFIVALRNIAAGEELSYDYGLIIDEPYTRKLKAEYPCWCGAATCRGTLLAPKRGWRPPMPGDALPAGTISTEKPGSCGSMACHSDSAGQ